MPGLVGVGLKDLLGLGVQAQWCTPGRSHQIRGWFFPQEIPTGSSASSLDYLRLVAAVSLVRENRILVAFPIAIPVSKGKLVDRLHPVYPYSHVIQGVIIPSILFRCDPCPYAHPLIKPAAKTWEEQKTRRLNNTKTISLISWTASTGRGQTRSSATPTHLYRPGALEDPYPQIQPYPA